MHLQQKLEEFGKTLSEEFRNFVIGCRMTEGIPTVFLTQDPPSEMPGTIGGMEINYQNVGHWEP